MDTTASCSCCGATTGLYVAYRYWTHDAAGYNVKASKYLCSDRYGCVARIDAKHAAKRLAVAS